MTLTEIILLLAKARTQADRKQALRMASLSNRFDEDQRRQLQGLTSEIEKDNGRVLRPITNLSQENPYLTDLEAGSDAIMDPAVSIEIDGWVKGWKEENYLRSNHCEPPGPLLLEGPTGCGKTTITRNIKSLMVGRPACVMDCHRMLESHLGGTGERLMRAFEDCTRLGALLVMEEIDGFAGVHCNSSDGASSESNRIVIALMRLIEDAKFPLVATTNRLESLDPALLRRFELQLEIEEPELAEKHTILERHLGRHPGKYFDHLSLSESVPFAKQLRREELLQKMGAATI